ncbi:MAG TPA: SpoIIE family protein phosphatase [Mycobacteriales bacterium]|nr:SpoIIE family protein phosphatase [Mycobacteriales bacterium]
MSAGWDAVPAGLLTLDRDGTLTEANATFLSWVGRPREDVVGRVRLSELLSVGGRIYWETHLGPLLLVERRLDEVAVELRGVDERLPVLLTAVAEDDGTVHVVLSSARERSRYERELRAARESAERSAAQVEALQLVTAALSRAVGVSAVAQALLDAAVRTLGASAAALWLPDGTGALQPHGARGELSAELPRAAAVLHERTAVELDGRVVVPLHGSNHLRGVLIATPRSEAGSDPLDVEVLTAVGQQAGLALDRAGLYEQNADVARELQHSLLAVDPPADPRFTVAAAYRPGVEALEVGGDWYDVFLADTGLLSVVVGDVVGRGLGAASAMGQLRSAVRAVSGPRTGPAALLTHLDRFVGQVEAAGMATLAYAELDLDSGEVTYACAGHPPPLLVRATGAAALLWEGRSTPLGAFASPGDRHEATLQLAAGDRLLLYTDGLIERRDRSLDDGLELLRATAAELAGLPIADAVRELTTRLLQDEVGRDDVCVLLVGWDSTGFERHVSADLTGLSRMRHDLAGWLEDSGVDSRTGRDVVLATSEAVANAAEHGSDRSPDRHVRVRARLERHRGSSRGDAGGDGDPGSDGGTVVVEVHDGGRWRTPTASPERGRGLQIMGALVDDVVVESADGTTVVLRRSLPGVER